MEAIVKLSADGTLPPGLSWLLARFFSFLFTQIQASRLKELLHQFLAAYAEGTLPEGCFQSRFVHYLLCYSIARLKSTSSHL